MAKMAGYAPVRYLSLDICSLKLTVLLELCSRKTVHFSDVWKNI